jgi:hypothetical protein
MESPKMAAILESKIADIVDGNIRFQVDGIYCSHIGIQDGRYIEIKDGATERFLRLIETRPSLHIHECWSELKKDFKVHFYLSCCVEK